MLRSYNHKSSTKERIGPGRKNGQLTGDLTIHGIYNIKPHLSSEALPNPITLHDLNWLWPIQRKRASISVFKWCIKILEKTGSIIGDAHNPLFKRFAINRKITSLTTAIVCNFFIGQYGAQPRTPVNNYFLLIGKPIIIEHSFLISRFKHSP